MHARTLHLGALSIALATTLAAGSTWAAPPAAPFTRGSAPTAPFQGWTPLSDYVSAGLAEGGSFRLSVPTRRGVVEVALHPVAVAASDYHAEEAVHAGERRGRKRPAIHTFSGTLETAGEATHSPRRGGDFVRLAREPGGHVSGLMRVDGVLYDLSADPAAGDLVLGIREIDAAELAQLLGFCGAAIDEALAGLAPAVDSEPAGDPEPAGAGGPGTAAAATLLEVELGTEADAPFVAQVGSVSAANAKILSIVNSINGIYELDLGLTHRVVFQRAWNGSDPYTSSDSDTLLTQFRGNFLANVATPTDDAQMFSGRDFENSVVGRAFVSAACTSARFGVNQYYQQSESLTRLIAAHEMGHNFGGSHTADGIMAASINPSVTWFSATSQSQIGSYAGTLSCLAEVATGGPPLLAPIGPQNAPEDATLEIQLEASDPDGDAITWSALPLPIGASLSAGGLFQWKPPLDTVGCGSFEDVSVTLYAIDPDGNSASESVVISVLDTPSGAPPDLGDPADRSAPAGQPITLPLSADDADGDSVSFDVASLPDGASLSPEGTFSWTPSEAQLGPHTLSFTATDCTGQSASQDVSIEVVSSAPHLSSLSAQSGVKGDTISVGGQNFAGRKVFVYFGTKKAKALSVSDDSVLVRVPKKKSGLPDALSISLMRDGIASDNSLPFSYVPPAP